MKRLLCLLLGILLAFCSCHTVNHETSETSDIPALETESDEIPSDEITTAAEDTNAVSSERYIREYEITELHTYKSNAFTYFQNGKLYIYEKNGTKSIKQTTVDPNGTVETAELPASAEFGVQLLFAYYPLSDNRFLALYQSDLVIMDADGTTLQHGSMSDQIGRDFSFVDMEVYEDTGGKLHILLLSSGGLCYLDETLTVQTTFGIDYDDASRLSANRHFAHASDAGTYCTGGRVQDFGILDVGDETYTRMPLHLPRDVNFDRLYHGYDGNHYFSGNIGIQQYAEDRQPEMILRWDECGYKFDHMDDCWVVDSQTILLARRTGDALSGSYTLYRYHIQRTLQAVSDKDVITLYSFERYAASDWLPMAIYQFNRTNEHYKINLVNNNTYHPDERKEAMEAILLNGTGADMILPYAPEELFPYFDKNAFADLNPYIGNQVLGCIRSLYADGNAMYIVPMSFTFTTLIANTGILNGAPLTWDAFYAVRDALPADAEFIVPRYTGIGAVRVDAQGNRTSATEHSDLPAVLYDLSLSDYLDWETQTTAFDTDAFRNMILCLQQMAETMDETVGGIENFTYIGGFTDATGISVSNGALIPRLRQGGAAFAEVMFSFVDHFSLLQRLFGTDAGYEICGYPSKDGGAVAIHSVTTPLAVLESSPNKEGCIEFLEFLLSTEWQNHPENSFLPVTPDALSARLDEQQYYYYKKYRIDNLNNPGGGIVSIERPHYSKEYDENFSVSSGTVQGYYQEYTAFPFPEEDRQALLDFFENITIRTKADEKILEIVNEELSYWQSDARSLEETTKIIDSRVWIYLNE
ncbi:MAG: carbohydrate ABC transporter substrate-binding protein [Ruminococcaceae bacterium]|nr:carbohydrate ABC transporter substrate-binding protein [Oscillospiraceae bacterium]